MASTALGQLRKMMGKVFSSLHVGSTSNLSYKLLKFARKSNWQEKMNVSELRCVH